MKKRIIYIPLEDLPQRYSIMMNKSIRTYFQTTIKDIVDYIEIYPNVSISDKIENGQFLDINNTCKFKSAQLQAISEMFIAGEIKNGDIFFIGDIFFPGIEMIRYMAELQNIKVKIFGINYAGRSDENDFVRNLGPWADFSETGYHMICDGVFLGSIDHRDKIIKHFYTSTERLRNSWGNDINKMPKLHVTGLIWDVNYLTEFDMNLPKLDYVIWPHRICAEKGFLEMIEFAKTSGMTVVVTSCGPNRWPSDVDRPDNVLYCPNLTKDEYYMKFQQAKWYLSNGKQETFGYTVQEAIYFDCNILVPDRVCYPQMVPAKNLYTDISVVANRFKTEDLTIPLPWTLKWSGNIEIMSNIMLQD